MPIANIGLPGPCWQHTADHLQYMYLYKSFLITSHLDFGVEIHKPPDKRFQAKQDMIPTWSGLFDLKQQDFFSWAGTTARAVDRSPCTRVKPVKLHTGFVFIMCRKRLALWAESSCTQSAKSVMLVQSTAQLQLRNSGHVVPDQAYNQARMWMVQNMNAEFYASYLKPGTFHFVNTNPAHVAGGRWSDPRSGSTLHANNLFLASVQELAFRTRPICLYPCCWSEANV